MRKNRFLCGRIAAALVVLASVPFIVASSQASAGAGYAPMQPFDVLAGRTLRGEGVGPNGAPIVDIVRWEFILGGRALQSTHLLESGVYGGKTVFFYDEAAKTYVFHYFTTAGFHTTGVVEITEEGFESIEKVEGHPTYAEVRARITIDGENVRVASWHITHEGESGPEQETIYKPYDGPGPDFSKFVRLQESKSE